MKKFLVKAQAYDGKWGVGLLVYKNGKYYINNTEYIPFSFEIDPNTICRNTGLEDKNKRMIFENDILMCNNNPRQLVKVVFGEFPITNIDNLKVIDKVIGWHYEVIETDALSKIFPFCLPMPLNSYYINRCSAEILCSLFDASKEIGDTHGID